MRGMPGRRAQIASPGSAGRLRPHEDEHPGHAAQHEDMATEDVVPGRARQKSVLWRRCAVGRHRLSDTEEPGSPQPHKRPSMMPLFHMLLSSPTAVNPWTEPSTRSRIVLPLRSHPAMNRTLIGIGDTLLLPGDPQQAWSSTRPPTHARHDDRSDCRASLSHPKIGWSGPTGDVERACPVC